MNAKEKILATKILQSFVLINLAVTSLVALFWLDYRVEVLVVGGILQAGISLVLTKSALFKKPLAPVAATATMYYVVIPALWYSAPSQGAEVLLIATSIGALIFSTLCNCQCGLGNEALFVLLSKNNSTNNLSN